MADDELSAPLGQNAKKQAPALQLPIRVPHVDRGRARAVRCWSSCGWALVVDDPLGGEPIAVVAPIDRARSAGQAPASKRPIAASRTAAPHDGPGAGGPTPPAAGAAGRPPPGSKTVTIIDGTSGKRQEVVDPGPGAASRAPRRRRQHAARRRATAPIPKIARRRRAAVRRLRPRRASRCRASRTRRGSRSWSAGSASAPTPPRERSRKLPGAVTLAFAPYGADLERAGRARARRRPRDPAAGADGAVRLSRQRSRPADAADLARRRSRTSTACTG